MRRFGLTVLLLVSVMACTSEQAPEIVPAGGSTTPTTSRTLAPCPVGGPDATTPAAGCIAEDGSVQRP